MIDGIHLRDYIKVSGKKFGYAHYTCNVYIRKDIPKTVTKDDVADFVDDYCKNFGYKMERAEAKGDYAKYKMKIFID